MPKLLVVWSKQALLVRRALLNVDRYALTTLYGRADLNHVYPGLASALGPRAASGEALALAATIATGAYDAGAVGKPLSRAVAVASWLVASTACRHAAVTRGGWGAGRRHMPADLHEWQSPLVAAHLGTAAWLLWRHLSAVDRYSVAAMVRNEADRLINTAPNYYATRTGRVLFRGDTKAEEDAWVARIFSVASAMMPGHPHARRWRHQEARFELAAYARAVDTRSNIVVNGHRLRSWLAGWNVFPRGTVVNHSRHPHPDYMASIGISLTAAGIDGVANRPTLRAAIHNAPVVYQALTTLKFSSPPYRAPGGTIYRAGSAELYYPRGGDWGTFLAPSFVRLDAAIAALRLSTLANRYLALHTNAVLAKQARSSDGRTYRHPSEHHYQIREQWVAEALAPAWLVAWASAHHRIHITNAVI